MSDKNTKNEKMEAIVSLAKRRGFIYQGSEVYGGLSGTWDYGPLGVSLKRNIMSLWWKMFVEDREDMYGVDAAILMNQKVWKASGHVDTFTDPLITCGNCQSRYRADHIITDKEDYKIELENFFSRSKDIVTGLHLSESPFDYSEEQINSLVGIFGEARVPAHESVKQLEEYLDNHHKLASSYLGIFPRIYLSNKKTMCAKCGQCEWQDAQTFNMMFTTTIGPSSMNVLDKQIFYDIDKGTKKVTEVTVSQENIDNTDNTVYLRPETAQGIFTNYRNVVDSFYPDLPFGLAQQGKAFRNEISPRDFIFRAREFEQMEIEYFIDPANWEAEFNNWVSLVHAWADALGLPAENVHELEVPEADRAHYSKRTIDFEFDFPIGREELLGLAYRGSFDLDNIQREAGKNMAYVVKGTNTKFIPHVIEPSFGVERALMAVLSAAYTEDEVNGEKRVYLKLPEHLAPVKYAVSPLLKNKPELVAKAREVYAILKKKHGNVMWDDNGNIGKRYRRQDEIGTPYCVVVDFDSLEDNSVTIRERDTTEQKRVVISDL